MSSENRTGRREETPLTEDEVANLNSLIDRWTQETRHYSTTELQLDNHHVEQIKAFGKKAIPILLAKLAKQAAEGVSSLSVVTPGAFVLIQELYGERIQLPDGAVEQPKGRDGTPIPGFVALNISQIEQAYLDWGKKEGFLRGPS